MGFIVMSLDVPMLGKTTTGSVNGVAAYSGPSRAIKISVMRIARDRIKEDVADEEIRAILAGALAVLELPGLDNDGGPGDSIVSEIRCILHNHTKAELRASKLEHALANLVDDVVRLKTRRDLQVGVDRCESWFSMVAARRLLAENKGEDLR